MERRQAGPLATRIYTWGSDVAPTPSGEQTGVHEAGRDIRNGSVGGVSLWWKFRNRGAHNKRGANHYGCSTHFNDGCCCDCCGINHDCDIDDCSDTNNPGTSYHGCGFSRTRSRLYVRRVSAEDFL